MGDENQGFELRDIRHYPYLQTNPSGFGNPANGNSYFKTTIGQTGAFGFNFDHTILHEIQQGQSVKLTNRTEIVPVTGDAPLGTRWVYRAEFSTPQPDLLNKVEVGNFIGFDGRNDSEGNGRFGSDGNVLFVDENVLEFYKNITPDNLFNQPYYQEQYFTNGILIRNYARFQALEVSWNIVRDGANTYANDWDGTNNTIEYKGIAPSSPRPFDWMTGSVKNTQFDEFSANLQYQGERKDMQVDGEIGERTVVRTYRVYGVPLTPTFWSEELAEHWNNGTIPELYRSSNPPKLIVRLRMWLDENKSKEPFEYFIERPFDLGWLDENGNGGQTDLKVVDVGYTNVPRQIPAEGLSKNEQTVLKFKVQTQNRTFNNDAKWCVTVFRKTPYEEYFQSNELLKNTYTASWSKADRNGGAGEIGKDEFNNSTTQVNIVDGGKGMIVEVTYSPVNSTATRVEDGDEYILIWSYWNKGDTHAVSTLIDIKPYQVFTDQDGLIECVGGRLLDPDVVPATPPFDPQIPTVTLQDGYSNMECWNEDGLISFWSLRQFKQTQTKILKLTHRVIANRNSAKNGTTDYSDSNDLILLQETEIPFEEVGIDDGVPIYDQISQRAFNLAPDDVFKEVRVRTHGQGVGFAYIDVNIGFKVDWQYWKQLLNIPFDFYNPQDAFNGYNARTSNYSEKPISDQFDVRSVLIVEMQNTENPFSTEYAYEIPMQVFNYGEDKWTRQGETADLKGEIFTEKLDGTDLNGSILNNEPTVMKIHWTNIGGRTLSGNFWFMHRIEKAGQLGYDIWELSTLKEPVNGSPLIPHAGEQSLRIYPDGTGGYWSECVIDNNRLQNGVGYKVSGRIGENEKGTGFGYGYSIGFTTGFDA